MCVELALRMSAVATGHSNTLYKYINPLELEAIKNLKPPPKNSAATRRTRPSLSYTLYLSHNVKKIWILYNMYNL